MISDRRDVHHSLPPNRLLLRGTGDLAVEDGQLVVKHEDLGVLGDGVHPMDPKQFGHAANQAV